MKTIAISIEPSLLASVDRIAASRRRGARGRRGMVPRPNRSEVIRQAVRDFILRQQNQEREARERGVLARHRARLERQLEALVLEQAES